MEIKGNVLITGPAKDKIGPKEPIQFFPNKIQKRPEEGWQNEPFKFTGERGRTADGCLFTIDSASQNKNYALFTVINKRGTYFQEAVQKGTAYWLAQAPTGKIIVVKVDESMQGTVIEWGGKGWINTWIAGKNGAQIVDITEPAFIPDVSEEELELRDERITDEYRQVREALINGDDSVLKKYEKI